MSGADTARQQVRGEDQEALACRIRCQEPVSRFVYLDLVGFSLEPS